MTACAGVAIALSVAAAETAQTRALVLDNVRIIDGSGAAPIENGRIVIERRSHRPRRTAPRRSACPPAPRRSTSPAAP